MVVLTAHSCFINGLGTSRLQPEIYLHVSMPCLGFGGIQLWNSLGGKMKEIMGIVI